MTTNEAPNLFSTLWNDVHPKLISRLSATFESKGLNFGEFLRVEELAVRLPPEFMAQLPQSSEGRVQIDRVNILEFRVLCAAVPEMREYFSDEELTSLQSICQDCLPVLIVNRISENYKLSDNDYIAALSKAQRACKMLSIDLDLKSDPKDNTDDLQTFQKNSMAVSEVIRKASIHLADENHNSILDTVLKDDKPFASTQCEILAKKLADLTKCSVCSQTMTDFSRSLPCLHSYCRSCIKDLVDTHSNGRVVCRKCGVVFKVPLDIHKIYENPIIAALMSLRRRLSTADSGDSKKTGLQCEECVFTATSLCVDCKSAYCDYHIFGALHTNNDSSQHQTIRVEDILSETSNIGHDIGRYCIYHHGSTLSTYCKDCCMPLCAQQACRAQHGGHTTLRIGEARNAVGADVALLIENLRNKINRVEKKRDEALTTKEQIENLKADMTDSVNRYFTDMIALLEERRLAFLAEIETVSDACVEHAVLTKTDLDSWVRDANRCLVDIDNNQHEQCSCVGELNAQKTQLLDLWTDPVGGQPLEAQKLISYPEGNMRNILQQIGELKPHFSAVRLQAEWDKDFYIEGLTAFEIKNERLYCIRRFNILVYQVGEVDIRREQRARTQKQRVIVEGMKEYLSVAVVRGKLAVAERAENSLEIQNLKMRRTCRLIFYDILSKEKCGEAEMEVASFTNLIIKAEDDCLFVSTVNELVEYKVEDDCTLTQQRRYSFQNMLEIADFVVEKRFQDILIIVDRNKCNLVVYNCLSGSSQQCTLNASNSSGLVPFNTPIGVAKDEYGYLAVADAGNKNIHVMSQDGQQHLKTFSYPTEFLADTTATSAVKRVLLYMVDGWIYMYDSRLDSIWKRRYL